MKLPHVEYPQRCSCCRCNGHYLVAGRCRFCNKGRWKPYALAGMISFAVLVIAWMLAH